MMLENEPIAALRLTIASPMQIRAWSSGEVTQPETINYLTEKPEPDGLFCESIFGPTTDWTCACGKYRRERTPGFVCEVCGVQITTSSVRRERMGHIELAAPVAHPWFARHAPSIIALLLGFSQRKLTAVLSYTCYLVLAIDEAKRERALMRRREGSENEAHDLCPASLFSDLAVGDILDETTFRQLSSRYGDVFRAGTGAEAIRELLAALDLNVLYERVIYRNNRVKRFLALEAPEVMLNNEKRLLQEACDALFDNGHRDRPLTGSGGQPLKSLTDTVSGKRGRLRKDVLGKRVDYSGR